MTWLVVDAMNVIGSRPDGWWHDRAGAVRDLVARCRVVGPELADAITVVVDGTGDDEPAGERGVEVIHAGHGPDAADDRIVELLDTSDLPATVVTADRRLRERVTARGASLRRPRRFRDELHRLSSRRLARGGPSDRPAADDDQPTDDVGGPGAA